MVFRTSERLRPRGCGSSIGSIVWDDGINDVRWRHVISQPLHILHHNIERHCDVTLRPHPCDCNQKRRRLLHGNHTSAKRVLIQSTDRGIRIEKGVIKTPTPSTDAGDIGDYSACLPSLPSPWATTLGSVYSGRLLISQLRNCWKRDEDSGTNMGSRRVCLGKRYLKLVI